MAENLLKCTTRHVRLFTAKVENNNLVPDSEQLTLDLDPDNEFIWSDACITKVQERFKELVNSAAGLQCRLGHKTAHRVHGRVHLHVHHVGACAPLAAELRVWHRHIQLLAAGDVALIALGGAGHSTANTNAHHQHTCQHGGGGCVEFQAIALSGRSPRALATWGTPPRAIAP